MKNYYRVAVGGFLIGLGILLPMLIHMVGGTAIGAIILPMHIPVFLAGLILGPFYGLIIGASTPVLSSFLTGMPPLTPPIAVLMLFELAGYGFFSGLFYRKLQKNIFLTLLTSMIAGRIVLAFALSFITPMLGFNPSLINYLQGTIVSGIPGIVLQLILVPLIVKNIIEAEVTGLNYNLKQDESY